MVVSFANPPTSWVCDFKDKHTIRSFLFLMYKSEPYGEVGGGCLCPFLSTLRRRSHSHQMLSGAFPQRRDTVSFRRVWVFWPPHSVPNLIRLADMAKKSGLFWNSFCFGIALRNIGEHSKQQILSFLGGSGCSEPIPQAVDKQWNGSTLFCSSQHARGSAPRVTSSECTRPRPLPPGSSSRLM